MRFGIRPVYVVDIISGDQTDIELTSQLHKFGICFFLFRNTMILEFDKEIITAENLEIFARCRFSPFHVASQNQRRYFTGNTGTHTDQPFMMGRKQFPVNSRFIIKSFGIGS